MNGTALELEHSVEAAVAPLVRAIEAVPHEALACVEVSVPTDELEPLFEALPEEDAVFWAAPGDETVLALGVTRLYCATGADRFSALREATRELPPWARLFAGFSFAHGSPGERGRERGFGEARALLPRFVLRRAGGQTTLSLTIDRAAHDENTRARLHIQLAAIVRALRRPPPRSSGSLLQVAEDPAEANAFRALVAEARRAVRAAAFDKVVVHRQTLVPTQAHRDPGRVLAHLAESQSASTRYAFRVAGSTFLGATPERLVRRVGHSIFADVLAGSLPRDRGETSPRALLASDKDRAEHELTRRAIIDALAPHCTELVQDGPKVRTLPHLHHLHTAIEGRLATRTHVLDLVAALHPTPAVGGVPREAALAFIAQHEHAPRGWYAAPVGWFRPDGDGDFSVALRCALLAPSSTMLYSGAGIVADSDPDRELAETASKRRAVLSALGLEIGAPRNSQA